MLVEVKKGRLLFYTEKLLEKELEDLDDTFQVSRIDYEGEFTEELFHRFTEQVARMERRRLELKEHPCSIALRKINLCWQLRNSLYRNKGLPVVIAALTTLCEEFTKDLQKVVAGPPAPGAS